VRGSSDFLGRPINVAPLRALGRLFVGRSIADILPTRRLVTAEHSRAQRSI
jgi:hypothetical protein